uniref:RRM domain-containing protein n=1 Tax=Glossina brevipalpis TaxID=37001 RepID=A0A1A9W2U2_9MUSC
MKKLKNLEKKSNEGEKQLFQDGKIIKKKQKIKKESFQQLNESSLQRLNGNDVKDEVVLQAKKLNKSGKKLELKKLKQDDTDNKISDNIQQTEMAHPRKESVTDIKDFSGAETKQLKKKKDKPEVNEGKSADIKLKKTSIKKGENLSAAEMEKKTMKKGVESDISDDKSDDGVHKKRTTDERENINGAEIERLEEKKAKKLAQKEKKKLKKLQLKEQAQIASNQSKLSGVQGSVNEALHVLPRPSKKVKNHPLSNSKNGNVDETKETITDQNADKEGKTVKKMKSRSAEELKLAKKQRRAEKRARIKKEKEEVRRLRDPAIELATVFVGNLPVNTKRTQLVRLFKGYEPVNAVRMCTAAGQILIKHKMRREAGSLNAYVVLKDKETAERALALNGIEFKGNHLRVTPSDIKNSYKASNDVKRTVFVGNLKYSATEETLREIFSSCGEINYIRCLREDEKGCKGVAYVCFKSPDAVGLALELNETMLDERPIHVERYDIKKLGAKEARTAEIKKHDKTKKWNQSVGKDKTLEKTDNIKKKKNEFKGVKIDVAMKKKLKQKKKKPNNEMLKLAKKIAPKSKV